ncbi:MAG: hypothetical protein A3C84_02585 [Candidatus Ryanbacteria bacterium RIFCSPHIGHO2_02_FULL_48_12]|jgi:hypothetical protein|uniref:RNA-binding protein KhpA n=1 Tax=Candidatus Ryanbacteria bacterium RIFCSPHIGHO2_01_FULL_48_27 TaxID=1802115 RepID=A0A1G2G5K8_9BACT|nr:MAG: hypothetical protein A2756_01060 [Candidatus Ryanbacteria bacterium RIFCSPHIGHO2_01_FULL_48_27]OGZ48999.1 MAG: hypothetical protein A3C84_02585 [Candidatus Ryanbacteria bacterium RIFCSPHIGHO2_02_FULL_48_12]
MNADQEFLEYVVKSLVDNPSAVRVDRKVDEMGVLLTLHVDPANMGQIIGRNGNTAKAIRTLLRVVGMKNNARVNLKIEEPEGGMRSAEPRMKNVDEVVDDLKL